MILSLLLASFLTFVELNCENLFDCKHDSLKDDTEFLPEASRHWKPWKYWRKLNNIAKEIIACGENEGTFSPPDFIALCEVENDSVLFDLTRRSVLRNARYDYFMTSSPDVRGIDVALLYHRYSFKPITHYSLRVDTVRKMRPTRDILYVCGTVCTGDTLHIMVVHAPSRFGGERYSRPFRQAAIGRLTAAVDSILQVSSQAKIIIAGDFNDGPDGHSLQPLYIRRLQNATRNATGENGARGSYRYKGKWELIDHVFLSEALRSRFQSSRIFDEPYLLIEDTKYGGVKPRRTFPPYNYDKDGFSDHLPLIVRLKY